MIKRCNVGGANACLEKEQLALHNEYRLLHEGGTALKADRAASAAIQKLLDAKFKTTTVWTAALAKTPFVLAAPGARGDAKWASCVENVHVAADKTAANTKLATKTWYDTGSVTTAYDYAAGAPMAGKKAAADPFMRMIWKKTTLVGFGMKDKVVVAWYCTAPAAVTDKAAAIKNIGKQCIQTDKHNACFAKKALAAINGYRKTHDVKPLGLDNAASGTLQTAMDASGFTGTHAATPATCTAITYTEADATKVATLGTTTRATTAWYGYSKRYDFAAGAAKAATSASIKVDYAKTPKLIDTPGKITALIAGATGTSLYKTQSDAFTAMVWAGATKANIGVKGKYVVVEYCVAKSNDPATPVAFKANVSKACIKGGINECFNDAQLKLHNTNRALHKDTKALKIDKVAALAL